MARFRNGSLVTPLVITAFVLAWASLCALIIDGLQRLSLGSPMTPRGGEIFTFAVGSLVMSILLTLLISLTDRPWWSAALLVGISTAVGMINAAKIRLRFEPLYPADLGFVRESGALVTIAGARTVIGMLVITVGAGAVVLVLGRLVGSRVACLSPRLSHSATRQTLSVRATVCLVCTTAIVSLGGFDDDGNPFRWLYRQAGASWDAPSQALNYLRDGFVGGTLGNLRVEAMQRPSGYSEETMRALLARYSRAAQRINAHRNPNALDRLNVVVVLSESFADPIALRGAQPVVDPIPFTRRLMKGTTSGRMLAQDFGGGTANMEFEALTGLSMSQLRPSLTYPYSMLVSGRKEFPSAAAYFKGRNHATVAIHPFRPGFYSRDRAYPALGFDDFVSASRLQSETRITPGGFISDEAAFDEVVHQLRSHARPVFAHLVTMQNHGRYSGVYPDPLGFTGLTGATEVEAGNYARGLAHTDEAVHHLLEQLRDFPEPTAVVLFGDHQPGFWPDNVWQSSGYRRMHETPFWIWSNLPDQPAGPLPTTSPIYFLPTLLDQVNAPIPAFYALLEDLRSQIPAMDGGLMIGPDDRETTEAELPPAAKVLLHDYRLVEYDLTDGQGFIAGNLFGDPQGQ